MFQIHLVLALPQLWNQPLLQGGLVPFIGETKTWTLGVLIGTEMSLLLGSQGTGLGNICMYINPHIYTSIFLYLSLYLPIYIYIYI